MQYILLFATLIKCITPQFNHVLYKISDFFLIPAEIKSAWAAPSYILFHAGTEKKEMLHILFSLMLFVLYVLLQLQKVKCIAWK